MKINLLAILFAFYCSAPSAENLRPPETKEIIGSGIFEVNKTRTYTINDETMITLDDTVIDQSLFEIIGSGFKSAFTLLDDVNSTIDTGTINAIELITNLQGPVTSISPLEILGQPVLTTADTVLVLSGSIALDQSVAVSGYLSANNSLKATRIMPSNDLQAWKIRGFASEITGAGFKIGSLTINRGAEQIQNCDSVGGFNDGVLVEVKMTSNADYVIGTPVNGIQSIACLMLNQLPKEAGTLPSVVQGFISQTQGHNFWLNDIKVNVNNSTVYENGERDFIDEAINVEVQGVFNAETSVLQADVVRFMDRRIEITFPVVPEDVSIDESILINGVTFFKTPQSKDVANILAGIADDKQIQIRGYVDSNGIAYISKILDKGVPNFNNISLRGDISALDNPLFSVLNFQIDSSNSLIINLGAGVIDVETFFNLVVIGSQVEIKNAQYDSVLNQLINANITIRKIEAPNKISINNKEIIGSGIIRGFGTATITKTNDWMFKSDFE
ncbi:MAG: hypothetical protein JKY19_14515 [Alcanivoracaceae bacterium]|nr:hypothetical protein [Alcanivoracaceae bacterium]